MPTGVTPEERAKAKRVVEESKHTAQVDTGRLKKSISTKVNRGKIVFRQYFYGIYKDKKGVNNSDLIQNAKRIMGDTPYTVELLDEDGQLTTIDGKTGLGRTLKTVNKAVAKSKKKNNAKELIKKKIEQIKKDGESDKSNEDNRKRT